MKGRVESEFKTKYSCERTLDVLPYYIREYYEYLQASTEPRTWQTYLTIVYLLFDSIANTKEERKRIAPFELTDEAVVRYFVKCRHKVSKDGEVMETSFGYRRKVWYALNSFFKFMVKSGYVESNPMENIEKPRNKDDIKRQTLTPKELKKVLDVLKVPAVGENRDDMIQRVRDRAIIAILCTTGMRIGALSEINIEDYDVETNTLHVIDKQHKAIDYRLNATATEALSDYLQIRPFFPYGYEKEGALFLGVYNKERFNASSIRVSVSGRFYDILGKRIKIHSLRASFCTNLYEATKDIEFVRQAVGHSSILTTVKYIVPSRNAKEEAGDIMDKLLV